MYPHTNHGLEEVDVGLSRGAYIEPRGGKEGSLVLITTLYDSLEHAAALNC